MSSVRALFVGALLAALSGCATSPPVTDWLPAALVKGGADDFRLPGPVGINTIAVTSLDGIEIGGCRATVEQFLPSPANTRTPLIFAHGFFRDVANHRGLARHIASWGVTVYLVGHCPGGWSSGGVAVFANMLRAVADRYAADSVIYGGFSAGGLAARMASADDARAVGYLGLDPVGRGVMAQRASRSTIPLFGLFAPPQGCNAHQSGVGLFRDAPGAIALEVTGTTHCHFETPSDVLCRAACGEPGTTADSETLRQRITGLAAAYVVWRSGGAGVYAGHSRGADMSNTWWRDWWQASPGALREIIPGRLADGVVQ